jgi:hypothetical protein
VPVLALGFLIYHAVRLRRSSGNAAESSYFVVASAASVGLVLSAILTRRADIQHLLFVGAPLSVVLAWVLDGKGIESALLRAVRPVMVAFFLMFFSAFGLMFFLTGPMNALHRLETRRGEFNLSRPDEVIPYLLRHTTPGETVFVYPQQPLFYFLSATRSPTSFDFLQLGMHSDQQLNQSIEEVARDRTRLVVWDLAFNTETILKVWPAARFKRLAKDPIRDFILAHYRPCTTLRSVDFRYVILVRKDLSCPEESPAPAAKQ